MKNNTPIDLGLEVPVVKPRSPWKALLLAFFAPGVGQLYNGQWKKGLIMALVILSSMPLVGITHSFHSFYGVVIHLSVHLVIYIYTIVDAVRHARRLSYYNPKPYNNRSIYLGALVAFMGISFLINSLPVMGVLNFIIPSRSGEPTTQMGDWVMADTRAYKGKSAHHGDLVVFKRQGNFRFYRIVGLPGDQLQITNGMITINGKPAGIKLLGERVVEDNERVMEYLETLPNGHQQHIYRSMDKYDPAISSLQLTVPAGSYYVMGDSRDNAMDSRYEGPVASDSLVGKVLYSYWGKTTDRINVDLR